MCFPIGPLPNFVAGCDHSAVIRVLLYKIKILEEQGDRGYELTPSSWETIGHNKQGKE